MGLRGNLLFLIDYFQEKRRAEFLLQGKIAVWSNQFITHLRRRRPPRKRGRYGR